MKAYSPLLIILLLYCGNNVMSQPDLTTDSLFEKELSIFDHIYQDTILSITLETDIQQILKNKKLDTYQPAVIYFTDIHQKEREVTLQIKPRGKSRLEFCEMPPIKFKFNKDYLQSMGMAEHHTLKFVSHCKDDIRYRTIVLKEYLVYKTLNLITPYSFRVQLVEITFKDAKGEKKPFTQYGLFLESEDQLSERLACQQLLQKGLKTAFIESQNLAIFALFQYMIGNTDWIIDKQHNTIILKPPNENHLLAIPYDFDICGLVDAVYALPHPDFPIRNVSERHYMGPCLEEADQAELFQLFLRHRTAITELYENFELLPSSIRKKMIKYIDGFYQQLESTHFTKRVLQEHCD